MKRFVLLLLMGLIGPMSTSDSTGAAETVRKPDKRSWEITDESRAAAQNALKYLVRTQKKNGAWDGAIGYKANTDYQVTVSKGDSDHVGVTALAGMAFLAGGHLPGRGKWGRVVSRTLDNVLSHVGDDGYITSGGTFGTRMYSHAFAALFLAEVYGMSPRTDVRARLQRAMDYTVRSQNAQGGWRYLGFDPFSDMSVTVCQIMALRAARNVGIRVPQENIDRAVSYVLKSAVVTPGMDNGGFMYIESDRSQYRTSFSLTAAGLTTLYGCGVYKDKDLRDYVKKLGDNTLPTPSFSASIKHLMARFPGVLRQSHHYFFYYGNYYAVQAMFFRGGHEWRDYYPRIRNFLVAKQIQDGKNKGAWPINYGPGCTFSAAVGAIILQVPYRYLPILQR